MFYTDNFAFTFEQYQHNGEDYLRDENGNRLPLVDENGRRLTRCIIYQFDENGRIDHNAIIGLGQSVCSLDDQYQKEIGNGLAFSRALNDLRNNLSTVISPSSTEEFVTEVKNRYNNR